VRAAPFFPHHPFYAYFSCKSGLPMHILNVEFKSRVDDLQSCEMRLKALNPVFIGVDHQVDTYFHVSHGRLKLREGNIEHALIHYDREDSAGAKSSRVLLYKCQPDPALRQILALHLGVKVVVDKVRRIYFVDNVKFHFDRVEGLGEFLEVEAIDNQGRFSREELMQQCAYYAGIFGIQPADYIKQSYSDMMLERSSSPDMK
jgi:predicted adenylyl cyclase CyaB